MTAGATSSLGRMATTKAKILQAWVPPRHAAKFREIVTRKGQTVSGALYRYVLQVIRQDARKRGVAAFDQESR